MNRATSADHPVRGADMLALPVASSAVAYSFAPPASHPAPRKHHSHSPASFRSSSSSQSSRSEALPLAESLLRETEVHDVASPATSDGAAPHPPVASTSSAPAGPVPSSSSSGMDVCEPSPHIKVGRKMSMSSTASSGGPSTSSRRPSDPSRPARRKSQRVGIAAEIATHPSAEVIHLLASLLQHVARSNDARRLRGSTAPAATPADDLHIEAPDVDHDTTAAAQSAHSSSLTTLCFHARNVPSIAIEAYLLRILKYCPTTNEVFIALLVYFDRMSRSVPHPPPSSASGSPIFPNLPDALSGAFAIDSYNVHRLIIAGITVASKMLSDIFYTNSRYAKVGGLPLNELNQLELHFLLLNDFQLTIPLETMQEYGEQLLYRWRPPLPAVSSMPALPVPDVAPAPTPHRAGSETSTASTVTGDGGAAVAAEESMAA